MKCLWNSMLGALNSYSIILVPSVEVGEENKNDKYQLCFFPLVGALIGAILCGWNIAWPYL